MEKLTTFGILSLLFFALSCEQRNEATEEAIALADTSAAEEEEFHGAETESSLIDFTYSQRKGKRLFDHYCAVCHGAQGQGDGFNAYNLDPRPKDMTEKSYLDVVTDDWLSEAISQGGRGVKRSILMPSYENTLSKEQIADIVAYLHAFRK
ncbi:MAG: c-type cytochrome [bacterium]